MIKTFHGCFVMVNTKECPYQPIAAYTFRPFLMMWVSMYVKRKLIFTALEVSAVLHFAAQDTTLIKLGIYFILT